MPDTDIIVNSRFLSQNVSGVQRYAMNLSVELKKLDANIKFAAPRNIIQKRVADDLLKACVVGKRKGTLWEHLDLAKYARKSGGILVNLANTAPLFLKNQIVTIHDLAFLRSPEWFSKSFYRYYRFLIPRIARNSLKVITVSEFSKREIIDMLNVPAGKIKVIYNAVSDGFKESAGRARENRYGDYVFACASMDPRKNFKRLIKAFLKLGRRDLKLVIAGEKSRVHADEDLGVLRELEGDVIFTGYVNDDELAGLYKNAKLFAFPSLYEGFGIPPLEAMACGCPVVASSAASMPEVLGEAAHYVDPHDTDSIAAGMEKVLTDGGLRGELIESGYKRAGEFSWEKSARELFKVINEVKSL